MPTAQKQLPLDVGTATKDSEVIEAIHVIRTRNNTFYKEKALREALETWVAPYPKPLITNHNTDSEPLGRVTGAVVTKSILNPEYTTARLYLDVRDAAAREKLADGRYQTFSIGASVDSVTCSVCGRDVLQEDFCGHMRGRAYEGNTCYWIIESISSFDELSVVNVPSDPLSRRITSQVHQGEVKEGMSQANEQTPLDLQQTLEAVSSLLESHEAATTTEGAVPPEEIPPVVTTSDNDVVTVESVQAELATAQAELATVQAELATVQASLTAKETDAAELATKLAVAEGIEAMLTSDRNALQTNLEAKEAALKEFTRQNLDLARLATTAYREHAVTLAVFGGEFASREEAETHYAAQKIIPLQAYVAEGVKRAPTRPEQRIGNPAQVLEDEAATQTEGVKVPQTVGEFQDMLRDFMSPKRK